MSAVGGNQGRLQGLGESCCFLFLPIPTPFQPLSHPKVTRSPSNDQFLSLPIIYKSSKPRVLFENSCKDTGKVEIVAVAEMWERGRQRKCRRGAEKLPCDSITELPDWDLQERARKLLGAGSKTEWDLNGSVLFSLFLLQCFPSELGTRFCFPTPFWSRELGQSLGPVALRSLALS